MKLTNVVALALCLALAAPAFAAGKGAIPGPAEVTVTIKNLDTLVPQAASDDLAARTAAQKSIEMLAMNAARPGAEAERAEVAKALAGRLGPATPQLARVWLLRQLQLMGRAEAVPAVAALLDDKDALVRESARRALQYNPSEEAAAALRAALDKAADTPWRVALINACSQRRDAAALPAILKALGDKDESVALAAIDGIGVLGGADAAKALAQARKTLPAKLLPYATDAYLKCADRMAKEGKKEEAVALYQAIYTPSEPRAIQIAALRGLIVAGGPKAVPMVAEILAGKDAQLQGIALSFVQEIPGPEGTAAIVGLIAKAAPAGQAALVAQLDSRGDPAAKPAVLEAARSKDDAVRTAALAALGALGGAPEVALLAQAAATAPAAEAAAARASLARLHGQDVNQTMIAGLSGSSLSQGDAKVRCELLRALADRKADEAAPAVIKAAGDADPAVRLEAVKALDVLGDEKALALVISILVKAQADDERQAAEKTILSICSRAAGKDACLQAITGALAGAQMPARGALIRSLSKIGGQKAIAPVRAALADSDAAVKESAVRALADWPDIGAAADLLAIAKTDPKTTNQVLALRGYLRLAGLPDRPAAEKIRMCQEALTVIKRPDEKKLVLGVLADVNSPEALLMVVPMLSEGAVKNEAASAAVKIAKGLGNKLPPETGPAMQEVLKITKDKRVIKDAEDILKKIKPAGKK
jgi:HEAT repeat protein